MTNRRGLFVSYRGFVEGPTGGVQACTREYLDVIRAAGIEVAIVPFEGDRRLSTRLWRQVDSSPYFRPAEPAVFDRITAEARRGDVDFIFLNQVALAPLARRLRREMPSSLQIILLSHGLESTDLLHLLRLRRDLPLSGRVRPSGDIALGRVIRAEAASRALVDRVISLSPFDVELERWMGSTCNAWLPRIITPAPLEWRPKARRLGYVGTLDHAPNLEGLVQTLAALERRSGEAASVRVVGGPAPIGQWLAARYPRVEFLGRLDDAALAVEASGWSGFLHPIFCSPRGCSTKLAQAIGWRIPVVTTPQGRRGYEWREGSLLEAENADAFARLAVALFEADFAAAAQAEVARVAATSPTLPDVAARLRRFLDPEAAPPS